MKNFTKEEQGIILELARVALADGETFDRLGSELDISDKELKRLQEKIEIFSSIDVDNKGNCRYCGGHCWEGEMCDEQQAGGFNAEDDTEVMYHKEAEADDKRLL